MTAGDIPVDRMTGTQKRMEPVVMRAETRDLVARWRERGIGWDTVIARLEQAVIDAAMEKHKDRKRARR